MTAVDHAELKRVAEGATPGEWRVSEDNNPFADGRHVFAKGFDGSDFVVLNLKTDQTFVTATSREQQQRNALFAAAANPAVVLALIADNEAKDAEIEGLKADRDEGDVLIDVARILEDHVDYDDENSEHVVGLNRRHAALSAAEAIAPYLRTHAPDSWRPMSEAPTDRIIIAMCRYPTASAGSPDFVRWDGTDGWIYSRNKPERVVCWAWKPREILGDWPQETALRPQTAESGE